MRVDQIQRREAFYGSAIDTKATLGITLVGVYLTAFALVFLTIVTPMLILVEGLGAVFLVWRQGYRMIADLWGDIFL